MSVISWVLVIVGGIIAVAAGVLALIFYAVALDARSWDRR